MPLIRFDRSTCNRSVLRSLWIALAIYLVAVTTPDAQSPEYLKLNYQEVPALEIKGYWDTSGVLVATDIEELPKPRRPKLRGAIQAIDLENMEITMYGIPIEIHDETQFPELEEEASDFDDLQVGQQIEVSCKVGEDNHWKARKIGTSDIKKSNKIKGSITKAAVDGEPPDTLEIHGLIILLTRETDINEPGSFFEEIEFDEMSFAGPEENSEGMVLGSNLHFNANFRQTVRSETEYDLSESIEADHSDVEPQIRLELTGYWNDNFRTFAQLRMRRQYPFNSDRGTSQSRDLDAGDTQLYFLARDIGMKGLTFKIGRQDVEEPREWLFDEYLDAIRIYYYGREPVIFEASLMHAIAPLSDKIDTWTDVFGQVQWYFDSHSRLRGYVLLRKDSDEIRNREPVWWGVGFDGRVRRMIRTWMEIAIMRGTDKDRQLRSWAYDFGATFKPGNHRFAPFLTFAYARATGDKTGGDGIDNTFRQTGYEDNVDSFGGVSATRYYGEVLDPELSNLKILTLALGFRPLNVMSLEAVYHSYRQDQPDNKLRGDLIDPPARPNEISDDIGWELDILFGVSKLWRRVNLSWVIAIFNPGQAFSPFLENAILNRLNLKIDL